MASIPLNEVPAPADLRDRISREWGEYRAFRAGAPPESLRSTNWATEKSGVPSHDRGRAIDLVTPDWSERSYLVEFGLWLGLRLQSENWNVIFYRRDFQPHLHVADWSGRLGKPEASIGVNTGVKSKYNYFLAPYAGQATELIKALRDIKATYTESNAVDVDFDYWQNVIEGNEKPPWESAGGKLQTLIAFVKQYWWAILIPIVIAIPLIWWMRRRGE